MSVSSNVQINTINIQNLNQLAVTALEQTAEALHTEVVQAQVMPRNTGALQNESTFVDNSLSNFGRVSLVSSTPYARRLYYHPEYNFHRENWVDRKGNSHGSNPNAKGLWFEDWETGGQHEDFCPKTFKRIYRQLLRGVR